MTYPSGLWTASWLRLRIRQLWSSSEQTSTGHLWTNMRQILTATCFTIPTCLMLDPWDWPWNRHFPLGRAWLRCGASGLMKVIHGRGFCYTPIQRRLPAMLCFNWTVVTGATGVHRQFRAVSHCWCWCSGGGCGTSIRCALQVYWVSIRLEVGNNSGR